MKKILYFILPLLELRISEKKINENIKNISANNKISLTLDELKKVNKEELEIFYNSTFDAKKIIEDKAKSGILGVTITIGLVYSITSNYDKLSDISSFIAILALVYSLISGYLALSILGDKNEVYKLRVKDLVLEENDKKEALAIHYELNSQKNIIRQNYVYGSYKHLIYALVLIIFAFLSNIFLYNKPLPEKVILDCNISTYLKSEKKFKNEILILSNKIELLDKKISYKSKKDINSSKVQ